MDGGFGAYEVDESMTAADMQGPSSRVNQVAGRTTWTASAAKSLAVLWFFLLGLYFVLGYLFRGKR